MTIATALIIVIIAVVFSALFSGTEIAFMQSSKVRMEIDAARGGTIDRILGRFSRHADMFISTLLVGNNVVIVIYGIAFSAIINPILEDWFYNDALVLITNTVISTILILFMGEFLPKSAFRINPNFMMRLLAIPLYLIYLVFYPLSLLVSGFSVGLMRLFGIKGSEQHNRLLTIDQIDDYLQHSFKTEPGRTEVENEVKIFRNAIDFKDTQIRECMIPRNEIVAVNIDDTSREELLQSFVASGLSKIAVFKEDIDNIVGYIHVYELFRPDAEWTALIKPVIFTPETMLANNMMRRMLSEKKSMAIVVDEFGGTSGLVTLEDLVEEIFGEIEDEHDKNRFLARRLPNGDYEFSGRAKIERINEEFGLEIPENDNYHTIAGYILENLEALPNQGDVFNIDSLHFEILRMSATRILLVRVTENREM